jgi:ABC-type phosphate transport system auxiliary subunit
MLSRWLGGLAAAAVTLVACILVILDLTDAGLRRWWDGHALTTDTVAGLLVLMITVLVVDQVVRLRQGNSRARAVAVQAAILMTQANRASQAVSQVLADSGDRDMAGDEFRTYTMMLLSVAPVLIDAPTSRNFLEQAEHVDGEMASALGWLATAPGQGKFPTTRLDDAVQALKSASTPLLQNLNPEMRSAVRGDDPTRPARPG